MSLKLKNVVIFLKIIPQLFLIKIVRAREARDNFLCFEFKIEIDQVLICLVLL